MTDLWSNPNLDGFKAVTAHFIERDADGNAVEASCMITFRFVEGSHTGEHLASIFFEILKENNILHKVCLLLHCRFSVFVISLITYIDWSNHDGQCFELQHDDGISRSPITGTQHTVPQRW